MNGYWTLSTSFHLPWDLFPQTFLIFLRSLVSLSLQIFLLLNIWKPALPLKIPPRYSFSFPPFLYKIKVSYQYFFLLHIHSLIAIFLYVYVQFLPMSPFIFLRKSVTPLFRCTCIWKSDSCIPMRTLCLIFRYPWTLGSAPVYYVTWLFSWNLGMRPPGGRSHSIWHKFEDIMSNFSMCMKFQLHKINKF